MAAFVIVAVAAILLIIGYSQLKPQGGLMEMRNVALCDLNDDGKCDAADLAIFQDALGTHRGGLGYSPFADVDADGVVTEIDRQMLFPEPVTTLAETQPQQPAQQPAEADPDVYKDNLNQSIDELNQLGT